MEDSSFFEESPMGEATASNPKAQSRNKFARSHQSKQKEKFKTYSKYTHKNFHVRKSKEAKLEPHGGFNSKFYSSPKFTREMGWSEGANRERRESSHNSTSKPYSFPDWVYEEEDSTIVFPSWVYDEYQDYDPVVVQESCGLSGPTPPEYTHTLFGFKPLTERFPIPTPSGFVRKFIVFGKDLATSYQADPQFDLDSIATFDVPSDCELESVDASMFLEAQSGFQEFILSKGVDTSDVVCSWVEDFASLFSVLQGCTNYQAFAGAYILFIKRHVKGSLTRFAIEYFNEILSDLAPQDGGDDDPRWLIYFRQLKNNWDSSTTSPLFSKVSKLLSMAVSIGLCSLSDVTFDICGLRAFSIDVKEKHVTAKDLFNCVLDTVSFFLEGGYQCFKQRSLRPLLIGDASLAQYEADYYRCLECCELAKAGNLQKFKQMHDTDLDKLLTETLEKCNVYCKTTHPGTERNLLLRQKEKLLQAHTIFTQTRLQGGMRIAPFTVGVFGTTSVGKTSVTQILLASILQANGFDAKDDRIVTLSESDKFMSNYRSYVNGLIIDDLANTKAQFMDKSPVQKIIEIVNNTPAYANMAEAELKGKVAIEPKCVMITRNVKERFAYEYSNEPASILRRENHLLTVKVKKQFATSGMLDAAKVAAYFGGTQEMIQDLWDITVETARPVASQVPGQPDSVEYVACEYEGRILVDASIIDVIKFLVFSSQGHFSRQKDLLARSENICTQIGCCSICCLPTKCCICTKELQPHGACSDIVRGIGSWTADVIDSFQDGFNEGFGVAMHHIDVALPGERTRYANYLRQYGSDCSKFYHELSTIDSKWFSLINWMPESVFRSWIGRGYIEWLNYPLYQDHFRNLLQRYAFMFVACIAMCMVDMRCLFLLPVLVVCFLKTVFSYREFLINVIIHSRDSMPRVFRNIRDHHIKYITGSCVAMAGVYGLVKAYRMYSRFAPQGELSPRSMEDIQKRDSEQNPWLQSVITPMQVSAKSECVVYEHLEHLVGKNLCHMSYSLNGKRVFCDAFFPCSNVAIIPQHIWRADELYATFSRAGNLVIGGNFKALLSKKFTIDIPDTDLCLTWVPNGGSWKDLSCYFPLTNPISCPASVLFKGEDGTVCRAQTRVTPGIVKAVHMSYTGLHYTLQDQKTFNGLCIAPIVSQTRAPAIIGFHLAGKAGTGIGAGGILTQSQFTTALESLKATEGVLLASNRVSIPVERYDCQFYESDQIHHKSPTRYLPPGANIEMYGSVKGRATYHSEVVSTPISPIVEEVCGVSNKWGKPQFHSWKPWQASLQYSSKPSPGMPGNLLQNAVVDYRDGLIQKIKTVPQLLDQTKPLSEMETLCGIDGRRFIDKMPGQTSMGYPLGGPKNDHITLLNPEEYPTHACPAELDGRFWEEAKKMEDIMLSGNRAYPIFKGCLKDEPTPVEKDKVRVFQSAPIELQLLVRKYYLPVARLLSLFPLVSECAVGINAHGPEWESFTQHLNKYGKERIFAGDYSKYDLRMPSQLVLAAFRILIDIASECGYSERDLEVMRGIATEIANPLMAYNGDLIMLFGSNPSGQNLTVYINGIVNSLLLRCYLGDLGYLPKVKARDIIAVLTYGDDLKGSNNKKYPVSIKGYAEFLAKYDMVFTMPDKNSELVDLMHDKDADFLKRKNAYLPELGMHLGALDENSIFKSLHSVLKSTSVSLREQCMMNIDGALREWFAHGKDVYEMRRKQMTEIANRADVAHGCAGLHMTFDDRVNAFCEKHNIERLC